MGKKSYGRDDAAKDTDSSKKSVDRAWHTARDDATEGGYFERGSGNTSKWDEPSEAHQSARDVFLDVFSKDK